MLSRPNANHALLECKTLKIHTNHIDDSLQLITVLMRTECEDSHHYSLCVIASGKGGSTDFRMIHDITGNARKAERIFHTIARGAVTPCTLADVLEDMIGI